LEIVPPVAASLRRQNAGLDFEFRLTLDPATHQWEAIAADAAALGVAGRVITLGTLPLDALAGAYQMASAVFLPTMREASTAVYPESFYFRRPLVTSDMNFARELCGDAAIYVPPREPETIAAQLFQLVRRKDLRERLIETGASRLASHYPSTESKFNQQMILLSRLARDRRETVRGRNASAAHIDSR
jgi:glycosyltransferase involved in cell wall biosynthesis